MADATLTPAAESIPTGTYQLIGFVIVGSELKATIKTPIGDVYQGSVTNWKRVSAIEVLKT